MRLFSLLATAFLLAPTICRADAGPYAVRDLEGHACMDLNSVESQSTLAQIVRSLDLRSFRNSTGPRRQKRLITPQDYGFARSYREDGVLELYTSDDNWMMSFPLLNYTGLGEILCSDDKANNGGAYNSRIPLEVRLGKDSFYHATGGEVRSIQSLPRCSWPPLKRRRSTATSVSCC